MRGFVEMAEYLKVVEQRDKLVAEIEWLKDRAAPDPEQAEFRALRKARFSPSECCILVALFGSRDAISREAIFDLLPGTKGRGSGADLKVIDVFVSKIRAKLGRDTIGVEHGFGYVLSDAGRSAIKALISAYRELQAA